MARSLFVYGTLTFPGIVQALTGKTFVSKPATLGDYFVAELSNHVFPGLIPKPGEIAPGILLLDVDDLSYQRIAAWENPEFEAVRESVLTEEYDYELATVFVWTEPLKTIKPWDRVQFEELHLDRYLKKEIPEYLKQIDK